MTAACALDARVLVLNKLYSAVRVVDARRAFTLLCKGSAEVISVESGSYVSYSLHNWAEAAEFQRTFEHEEHDWVTTPSIVVAVPQIIRLLGYERLPREPVKLNRRNIYARDHSQCQYCGRNFSTKELTLDHVVPRVQGGENSWTNLVCACVRCNARTGTCGTTGVDTTRLVDGSPCNPTITVSVPGSTTPQNIQCRGICFRAGTATQGICGSLINAAVSTTCADDPVNVAPRAPMGTDNLAICIWRNCTRGTDCRAPHICRYPEDAANLPVTDADPLCDYPTSAQPRSIL